MPKKNTSYLMPYDWAGWRQRIGTHGQPVDKRDAAITLGVSYATFLRDEKNGTAEKTRVWAAYGIEQAVRLQREKAAKAAAKSHSREDEE
jgi:hypothetical protein